MKKKFFLLGLATVLILVSTTTPPARADICPSVIQPFTNCSVVSPQLGTCDSYDYEVLNRDGNLAQGGDLNAWNGSQYQFWFSQNSGEYNINYCDGTTGQLFVKTNQCELVTNKETSMAWISIGLGFIALLMLFYNVFRNMPGTTSRFERWR